MKRLLFVVTEQKCRMKKCTKCRAEHPATTEFFTVARAMKDGLDIYCRPCRRAIAKAFYNANREKEIERSKRWNKQNPDRVAANMRRSRHRRPEASRAILNAWRRSNKDKVRAFDINKRAKRKAAVSVTQKPASAADVVNVLKSAKGKCYYCGLKRKLTIDHIIPLARGGTHEKCNLVAACGACNSSKGARDPIKFAQSHGLLLP